MEQNVKLDKHYSTPRELIDDKAREMFLMMEDKSAAEVGYAFGLDKFYKDTQGLRSAVTRAYNMVLEHPEKFGIDLQRAGYIQGKVSSRSLNKPSELTLREQREMEEATIDDVIVNARDLAARLVRKKLKYLDEHPGALKEEKLVQLTTTLAILFDKGQIIAGQATEHIAVMSNIPEKLDPEEAMKAILGFREKMLANKKL